ncbi:MAG TPA: PQQ-binding-like beta-propeller repeat protein [Bryobacteraceae bacterium]|nr:PQQ-binding-like beta-propeller repeat protein [Bryobacteraceae bacterium]
MLIPRTLAALCILSGALEAQDGAALYRKYCAGCHDSGASRVPSHEALRRLSPERILVALESGSMMMMGARRTAPERRAIAGYLAAQPFGSVRMDAPPRSAFCRITGDGAIDPADGPRWNGWGVDLANRRFQPAEMAGMKAADVPRLKLRWAFGFPGDIVAYAQPAVEGGQLYVGSAGGRVYSLDARSGCIRWIYEAEAPVRTAISIGEAGARHAVYFGDLHANVYAVNAANGELLWKTRVEEHSEARITGAPALADGRLYVPVASFEEVSAADPGYECCRFRGSVAALDRASGKIVWKTYMIDEAPHATRKNRAGTQLWGPSGAAVWSAPTIDLKRRVIYAATGDSYSDPAAATTDAILALDMDSGKLLWSRQFTKGDAFNLACPSPDKSNCPEANGPDFDFGSSPILVELAGGKRLLVAGQKSAVVYGLDPDRGGKLVWQTRVGRGGTLGGIQWGPAADLDKVYVALSDIVRQVTPAGLVLDPKAGGGLFALGLTNGEIEWRAAPPECGERRPCSPAQSAAVTVIPGVVFSGSSDGHLRAYSTGDGKIIWDCDTAREFRTVNGAEARGGSIDGPGPVIAGGMLYVNSGYGAMGGIPGNVLLAFGAGK